ncbi:MAG: DNA recombination protein RmuC, partial [Psychromonas sp.]
MLLPPLILLVSSASLIFILIIVVFWAFLRLKKQRDQFFVELQLSAQELLHNQNIN